MIKKYWVNFALFDAGTCEVTLNEELVKGKSEEEVKEILLGLMNFPKSTEYGSGYTDSLEVETNRNIEFEEI